jgi:hypothetical protein
MDKKQLKKILKPLVKECIKEALLEDGILSGIISEVAVGLSKAPLLTEARARTRPSNTGEEELAKKRHRMESEKQKRIKSLNESFGEKFQGVNVFEGSTPTPPPSAAGSHSAPGSLSGVDPGDSGVDISGLQALVGNRWKSLGGDK